MALVTTGGGIELVNWLLNHPGASQAIVEAQVPYHPKALAGYLGSTGPHRVVAATARDMAGRAFVRAQKLTGQSEGIIGVGCTAALATSRERRGEDRVHIALRLPGEYRVCDLRFEKGAADRLQQEEALSRFALGVIVAACGGVDPAVTLPEYATLTQHSLSLQDPLDLLLTGELDLVEISMDGDLSAEVERHNRLLFPGSFNPLHEGHELLAAAAGRLSGRRPLLELSVENVDKPPLQKDAVADRLQQLRGRFPAVVTRAPTFLQKARLFGGCHFAIGFDTAVRLLQGKYYQGGEQGMVAALEEFAAGDCRFWVAGRLHQGAFLTLADIAVPADYATLFAAIPQQEFRVDISSTELRAQAAKGNV